MKFKSRRPISRKFWSLLRYLPGPFRRKFIRSKFEICNDLPDDIVFKQAETADEISQALNLVYESFLELKYNDPNNSKMRFNKYLALPSAVILIAKQKDKVLGTLSIIPDSAFGLPSEITWPLSKYRNSGKLIAEISSLAIHRDYKLRRGKLLFHLCKIMYLYSKEFLNLDGIIISTTLDVEAFYTDVLLFEKVVAVTGKTHSCVKGIPSTCCFLDLTDAESRYRKTYSKKPLKRNLYKFFFQTIDSRIQLPNRKLNIQSYTKQKNLFQKILLKNKSDLRSALTKKDAEILISKDQYRLFSEALMTSKFLAKAANVPLRSEIRAIGWIFSSDRKEPLRCKVLDISKDGLKVIAQNSTFKELSPNSKISVAVQIDNLTILCRTQIVWKTGETMMGAKILNSQADWLDALARVEQEIIGKSTAENHKTAG